MAKMESLDPKDMKIAFLAMLVRKLIFGYQVEGTEMQALYNIIDDLPEVDASDFRY